MAIGMTPLTPLHSVLTDPEARFQRFGSNGSQLYGKPLVDLAPLARAAAQPEKALSKADGAGAEFQKAFLEAKSDVSSGAKNPSAPVSKTGTYLDLQA